MSELFKSEGTDPIGRVVAEMQAEVDRITYAIDNSVAGQRRQVLLDAIDKLKATGGPAAATKRAKAPRRPNCGACRHAYSQHRGEKHLCPGQGRDGFQMYLEPIVLEKEV